MNWEQTSAATFRATVPAEPDTHGPRAPWIFELIADEPHSGDRQEYRYEGFAVFVTFALGARHETHRAHSIAHGEQQAHACRELEMYRARRDADRAYRAANHIVQ